MCIIVYKPSNTTYPTWNTLKECFNNNPNGAGFMYINNGKVEGHKGFMDFGSFKKAIKKVKATGYNGALVMHFRITTHGGTKPENTHPFPLTTRDAKLRDLHWKSDVGIAHNGTIPLTYSAKDMSDTMEFIRDYATRLIHNSVYYRDPFTCNMLEELANSRLCILSDDGHVELLGTGWNEHDGCWYSNTSWKPYVYKYSSVKKSTPDYYDWGWYKDEETEADKDYYEDYESYCDSYIDEVGKEIAEFNGCDASLCKNCKDKYVCYCF